MLENVPFIGCINLKLRKDKFIHMKKEFKNNNIKNVHFLLVDKHELGGRIGCFNSHLLLYKYCLKNNYEYALIFEDDIKINTKNIKNTIDNFMYIKNKYPNWYKVNCHNWGIMSLESCITNNICNASGQGNCCYFISKLGMKKSLNTGITYNHIDLQQYFDFPLSLVFYITQPLANILPLGSDNIDYGDNFWGKISFLCQNYNLIFPQILHHQLFLIFPIIYGLIIKIFVINQFKKEYESKNKKMFI